MKKQMLRVMTTLFSIVIVSMVLAGSSTQAQSLNSRANIPFDFVVGDRTLSAGDYAVSSASMNGTALRISGITSTATAVRLTNPAEGKSDGAKLVFHRYGQRYFLVSVWTGEGGRVLMASKEERNIRKEQNRIAANKPGEPGFEIVEIALL